MKALICIISLIVVLHFPSQCQTSSGCKFLLNSTSNKNNYLRLSAWEAFLPNKKDSSEYVTYTIANLNGDRFITFQFHFGLSHELISKMPKGIPVSLKFQNEEVFSFNIKKSIKLRKGKDFRFYQFRLDLNPDLLKAFENSSFESLQIDWKLNRKEYLLLNENDKIRKNLNCVRVAQYE